MDMSCNCMHLSNISTVIVSELSKKRGAWCVERGVMRREDEFETFVEKEYMVMEDGTVGEVGEVD